MPQGPPNRTNRLRLRRGDDNPLDSSRAANDYRRRRLPRRFLRRPPAVELLPALALPPEPPAEPLPPDEPPVWPPLPPVPPEEPPGSPPAPPEASAMAGTGRRRSAPRQRERRTRAAAVGCWPGRARFRRRRWVSWIPPSVPAQHRIAVRCVLAAGGHCTCRARGLNNGIRLTKPGCDVWQRPPPTERREFPPFRSRSVALPNCKRVLWRCTCVRLGRSSDSCCCSSRC